MWNPFEKRGHAEVHSLVMKNPETGLHEAHCIVAADDLAEAGRTVVECFEAAVSRHRSDPDFSGQVVFVVRGPVPGTDLPEELAQAQSQATARAEGLETTRGRPFRVRVEYRQSSL